MDTARSTLTRALHASRPGRAALVAADLADLAGPARGGVELPLRLFWSPDRTFDLDQPSMLRSMYETVLREASRPEDLTSYLNGETLVARLAGPVPAQGRAAGVGGTASGAARGPAGCCLMPVSDLHREVAAVALRAAARHGFALGGGNALIAHGVIDRPTEDVDLFTDQEDGVAAAAGAVEAALRGAGFGPNARTRRPGWPRCSRGWAKGWRSGSSPRPAAGR